MNERHVTNGDSAAISLVDGLRCERSAILVSRDVLSCGPLPPLGALDDWRRQRDRFWYELTADADEPARFEAQPRPAEDLLDNLRALAAAAAVTVWAGRALSDQLTLAFVVQLAARAGVDLEAGRLRVVQFGEGVVGVGDLVPEQIAAHPPARPLDRAALDAAWTAVTAPEPEALLAFLAGAPSILRAALGRLLHRFPDAQTGLSRWDAELLAQIEPHGTEALAVLGRALRANQSELDCVGDTYLAWRLARLADPRQPFPAVALEGRLGAGQRNCRVRLTSPGLDARAGRRNLVDLNGVDDWVCGVQLESSAGRLWFHRDGTLVRG